MLRTVEYLKLTPLYEIVLPVVLRLELYNWYKRNKLPPTPQLIKHKTIKDLADKFSIKTLVETGTYLGTMINANKYNFRLIYTIELDQKLYRQAKKKFNRFNHIHIKQGDSEKILPKILKRIKEPTIFWLDAHYSRGITAKGKKETPIVAEIKIILKDKSTKDVLLIDDALNFNGKNDYPTIKELKGLVAKQNKNYNVSIKNNLIYILPNKL